MSVISVRDLHVGFGNGDVVSGVSFDIEPGQCLAIVGESGSGKSVTARSLIGLAGRNSVVTAATLELEGRDIRSLSPRGLRGIRGAKIGFVLQDALVSLDPLRPVGKEIADALRVHSSLSARARREKAIALLDSVGVPDAANRSRQRSGELSGGLRQRALIASALALDPPLLIADEPTTALDATVQARILELLGELKSRGTAILLISHDLAVVEEVADQIAVMKDGVFVEVGEARAVIANPQHEYTRQLIEAVPSGKSRDSRLSLQPTRVETAVLVRERRQAEPDGTLVLEATGLRKSFRRPDGSTHNAVDDVSFALGRGRTLGIVGESGSGKTTAARIVLGLEHPDSGEVRLFDQPWSALPERERRASRSRIGVIYQDPLSSFDPRWTVAQILADSLTAGRSIRPGARRAEVLQLLDLVDLSPALLTRRPLHLSGGQRQRVAIARTLAHAPDIIVCDEPVSALDVSVQAQVLDLLVDLQKGLDLSYLFISHDLGVVNHVSDELVVMKDGRIVEAGDAREIFANPQQDYTRELLSAAPHFSTI